MSKHILEGRRAKILQSISASGERSYVHGIIVSMSGVQGLLLADDNVVHPINRELILEDSDALRRELLGEPVPKTDPGGGDWPSDLGPPLRCGTFNINTDRDQVFALGAQPAPLPSKGDVWAEVIADLGTDFASLRPLCEARRQVGIDRYGTPLQRGNGRDMLLDLEEELLDATAYSRGKRLLRFEQQLLDLLLDLQHLKED